MLDLQLLGVKPTVKVPEVKFIQHVIQILMKHTKLVNADVPIQEWKSKIV